MSRVLERATVNAIAKSLSLERNRAADLSRDLRAARGAYDIAVLIAALPSGAATDKRLAKIELSLSKLVKNLGGNDMLSRRARLRISNRLKSRFSLDEWISAIVPILAASKAARGAGPKPKKRPKVRAKRDMLTREKRQEWEASDPKRQLCGSTLPKLYEKYSSLLFGIAKDATGAGAKSTGGIAFVIAAHAAMGLGRIGPETVKSHWVAVRRVKRPTK